MNKYLATISALAAILASTSAAYAADVSIPAAYDWSGFYVGLNAGAAMNNSSVDSEVYTKPLLFEGRGERVDDLTHNIEGDQTAFTGGGMIGYNYQIDKIVLGVEADFNYLGFSQNETRRVNKTIDAGGFQIPINLTNELSVEGNWYGTIRGRLGYAMDNVLIYGTGGAAYGHMSVDSHVSSCGPNSCGVLDGNVDTTNWGWTVGGGIEYGIDRWSVGAEYLFVDLGSADWDSNVSVGTRTSSQGNGSVDWQFSVVRATAKLRF